jgi:hypothetical protein
MRLGDPNGPIASNTVRVGELIFHRWECQDSLYGMLVKNCRVFDGGNDNVTLIDERGCPTKTGVIQSPPIYSDALNIAYAPIFAFHFPDRTQMNFRCQIQSCNKLDNECNGLTPPNCPNSQRSRPQDEVSHRDNRVRPRVDHTVDRRQVYDEQSSQLNGNQVNIPGPAGGDGPCVFVGA